MTNPQGFSWIEQPLLAALARPQSVQELEWLREVGIDLLISLTEDQPRSSWVNEAGLLQLHVPMIDMEAPSLEQLDRCVSAILRANERRLGVAVHCGAGMGRTGTVIACYFVEKGLSARDAIARTRRLRPGSVETDAQADVVSDFAQRRRDA